MVRNFSSFLMKKTNNNMRDERAKLVKKPISGNDIDLDITRGTAGDKDTQKYIVFHRMGADELSLEPDACSEAWTPYGIETEHTTRVNTGYNPNSHAPLAPARRVKKRGLRELSRWIELKKRMTGKRR